MKKLFRFLLLATICSQFLFYSCSDGNSPSNNDEKAPGGEQIILKENEIGIHILYADSQFKWNLWAWKKTSNKNYSTTEWPGNLAMKRDAETGGFYQTLVPDTSEDLGIIFVSDDGKKQTSDIIISKDKLISGTHFYFIYGLPNIFYTAAECVGVMSATIDSTDGKTLALKAYGMADAKVSDFTVKDSDENILTVNSIDATETSIKLSLENGNITKRPYTVINNDVSVYANITGAIIEDLHLFYDGENLGIQIKENSADFRIWAPTANTVSLVLYEDDSALIEKKFTEQKMKNILSDGIWIAENVNVTSKKYYQYKIENNGEISYVCDINAYVCSADSVASQILDINDISTKPSDWEDKYTNPFGNTGEIKKRYTEAIIYEMHIRDWSKAFGETKSGKFEEITEALKTPNLFADYLNDLGITHVQILPMFDYAQLNSDEKYNWGYNPYHYNVPEGRYVNYDSGKLDGKYAVIQLREMIKAFHVKGIAVNMDVVYNHTSGTGINSLYDQTVPGYFYRTNDDGSYSNGSGCGNEIASNRKMVKKYIINSLKHWMNDYHINGFRFDLMGLHETETMKEIYKALSEIDPNVMVYGEPWTGGNPSPVKEGVTKANIDECADSTYSENGVACFNDTFRNAIKGSEYPSFSAGHVSGLFNDKVINEGLIGFTSKDAFGFTSKIGRSINYVECHDNNTLFDKLSMVELNVQTISGNIFEKLSNDQLENIKVQDKLSAGYVFLSQGTPFINGGQEFLRSKRGNENSYESSDKINAINFSFKDTYSDVYEIYKGLIKLRKSNDAFTNASECSAETIKNSENQEISGFTKYYCKGTKDTFVVYFNATSEDHEIKSDVEGIVIDINDGDVTENDLISKDGIRIIPKQSFVIIKSHN